MKKSFLILFLLLLAFALAACGTASESAASPAITPESAAAPGPTAAPEPTPEPELTPEPEWLSDAVFDEVRACLFPAEGEKNVPLAQELLLPLVTEGDAEAMYWWAYIYDYEIDDNDGGPEKESLYWYELAAEQGHAKACMGVAQNDYVESEERAAEMVEKARTAGLFEQNPEKLGPDGCFWLGLFYDDQEDYEKALYWYSKGADMGDISSMHELGYMYDLGLGVAQDHQQIMDWYGKAADLGNEVSMHNLGYYFLNKGDNQAAMEWFQKASDAGFALSMNYLGDLYADEATNKFKAGDTDEGNRLHRLTYLWQKEAAELGLSPSMHYVASMYEYGLGVLCDYDAAMEWYIKAYENGYETAIESINRLLSEQRGVNTYFEHYGSLVYPNP